jgi:GNAT superfamily N-acetyltransferase
MAEFDCPSYNADVQRERGFPAGADELRRRLEASDAFVICSPEYNASMPGVLKNAVDWVSRFHPQPFHERHALLLSASPSMVGGNRGVWALRVPFEHLAPASSQWRRSRVSTRSRGSRCGVSGSRVAEEEGEIVGFAHIGPSDEGPVGEVYRIFVLPERWGTGVGRALVERALEQLRAAGFAETTLWVHEDNPRARRFHEAGGWRLDGAEKEVESFGIRVNEVRYRIGLR